jgi:cell division protein FtsZ
VRGVTDLMVNPGLVNLDFADIRTVMAEMGKAMMGTGESDGDDRAVKAAEAAISNPLLEDTSMRGARGVLINITGGYDMTLYEVEEAASRIRREVDEDANIIFGTSVAEDMNGRLRVSVVATGIDAVAAREAERPKLYAVGGGAPVEAVAGATVPPATPARAPVAPPRPVPAQPAAMPAPTPGPLARQAPVFVMPAQPLPAAEPLPAQEPQASLAAAEPQLRIQAGARPAAPPAAPQRNVFGDIFRKATGLGGLIRRELPEAPPAQPPVPPVAAPTLRAEPPAPRIPQRPLPQEEMGLDIPAFLRRQSN